MGRRETRQASGGGARTARETRAGTSRRSVRASIFRTRSRIVARAMATGSARRDAVSC